MFEILELHHVNIVVKDVAASKRFYCEMLGLKDLPRPADLTKVGAWLDIGDAQIHLIQEDCATHAPGDLSQAVADQPGVDLGSSRHFCLVIDDTDRLVAVLKTHDYPIAFGPIERFGGLIQTYCYDPDGHLIEFTQMPVQSGDQ
jgi:catechol 2,3-dioxygenase-like lactoylglutathione lyase family enzyme